MQDVDSASQLATSCTLVGSPSLLVPNRIDRPDSFRELAKEIGIKSASIHHHFLSKDDLGVR